MDRTKQLALLSKEAYNVGAQRSMGDWRVLKGLTDDNSTVYKNETTGEVVIAYRGTDPTRKGDLAADALIATGLQGTSQRFKEAEKKYKLVKTSFPNAKVTVTGHSLGGAQAMHVNRRFKVEAEVYNPGYIGGPIGRGTTIHSVYGDPISLKAKWHAMLTPGVTAKTIGAKEKGVLGAHALDNWLSEDDMQHYHEGESAPEPYFRWQHMDQMGKNRMFNPAPLVITEDMRRMKRERMQRQQEWRDIHRNYNQTLTHWRPEPKITVA